MKPLITFFKPSLWRNTPSENGCAVHVRGYVYGGALAHGNRANVHCEEDDLAELARSVDGHFAAVLEGEEHVCVISDRVMSIPMFYAWDGQRWRVSDNGGALARDLGLGVEDVNPDGALAMAMAGYTIGTDTLYGPLRVLGPGHAVILGPGQVETHVVYDRYSAWEIEDRPDEQLMADLRDVTLGILKKMIASAEGRTFIVPLSAGLDSRLIVSGLKHLNYENVKCFSYGIPGNHEARAAKRICAKLGYPWRFVPYHIRDMRRFFGSQDHDDYMMFADSCVNVAFEQDLPAIRALQKDGYIADGDIMVNGNSGDFISGNHILGPFRAVREDLRVDERRQLVLESLVTKHFRLWESLGTSENDARIQARLTRELDGPLDNAQGLHGIYEFMEMQDRQCKYVISGQRVYDYVGLDWRLPLWDCDYLDFWRTVPLRAKAGQTLYNAMLHHNNWGGVWQGEEWRFPQTVVPGWIRPLRFVLKVLHVPLGREAWRRFERRYLGYWMSNLRGYAVMPYWDVAKDSRGHRNGIAFYAAAYLASKGLTYDGFEKAPCRCV